MEKLARTVELAISRVNWFALGDAKRIASDMRTAVRSYKIDTADATHHKRLRDVAEQAKEFLLRHATNEAKETADELGRVLKGL